MRRKARRRRKGGDVGRGKTMAATATARATMFRLPPDLHARLVREAGARTARTGEWVSVNALVVAILADYFAAATAAEAT